MVKKLKKYVRRKSVTNINMESESVVFGMAIMFLIILLAIAIKIALRFWIEVIVDERLNLLYNKVKRKKQ